MAVTGAGELQASYNLTNTEAVIYHSALVQPGDEIVAVQTPGDSVDPSRTLTAMLHRRDDRKADFIHVYRAGSAVQLTQTTGNEISITVTNVPNDSVLVKMTDKGLQIV